MKDRMTYQLQAYIRENGFSPDVISRETGIPYIKLTEDARRPLNGEELLQLCAYLHVRPEDFFQNGNS